MTKFTIISFFLLVCHIKSIAQNYDWYDIIESSTAFILTTDLTSTQNGDLIAVGHNEGTLYVKDLELEALSSRDLFLISYSMDGNLNWATKFPMGIGIQLVEVDSDDNIIVTSSFDYQIQLEGDTIISNGQDDVIVSKFNSAGELIWEFHFGGYYQDTAKGLAVDENGNIYVSGRFGGWLELEGNPISARKCSELYMLKLDPDGNLLWFNNFPSTGCDLGGTLSLADNTLFMSGQINDTTFIGSNTLVSNGGNDLLLAKIDLDGEILWARNFFCNRFPDEFSEFEIKNSSIYAVGHFADTLIIDQDTLISKGATNDYNGFISKFNVEGTSEWTRPIGCLENGNTNNSIAIDSEGQLFTSGRENIRNSNDRIDSNLKLSSFSSENGLLVSTLQFDLIEGEKLLEGYSIYNDVNDNLMLASYITRYTGTIEGKNAIMKVNTDSFEAFRNLTLNEASLTDITSECAIESLDRPIAYDRCGNEIIGTTNTAFPYDENGESIVVWNFEDSYGNYESYEQSIRIIPIDNSVVVSSEGIKAVASGYDYQWVDCQSGSPIQGATFQLFNPSESGTYSVEFIGDSCSVISDCFEYAVLGLDTGNSQLLKLYPNPTSGRLYIGSLNVNAVYVNIIDLTGRKLIEHKVFKGDFLDLSVLSAGKYILHLEMNSQVTTYTIIRK